jgi:hypothetical protein
MKRGLKSSSTEQAFENPCSWRCRARHSEKLSANANFTWVSVGRKHGEIHKHNATRGGEKTELKIKRPSAGISVLFERCAEALLKIIVRGNRNSAALSVQSWGEGIKTGPPLFSASSRNLSRKPLVGSYPPTTRFFIPLCSAAKKAFPARTSHTAS